MHAALHVSRVSSVFVHDLFGKPLHTFPDHALDPEYREPQNEEHEEDHDKDVEQDAGNIGGCSRYAGEAEYPGED